MPLGAGGAEIGESWTLANLFIYLAFCFACRSRRRNGNGRLSGSVGFGEQSGSHRNDDDDNEHAIRSQPAKEYGIKGLWMGEWLICR